MNKIKKNIIKNICFAQLYSDEAKTTYCDERRENYKCKDFHVYRALKLICRYKLSDIKFCIQQDRKTGGDVVYFNIKEGTTNLQISFHTFNHSMVEEMENKNHFHTRWKKNTSSRENTYFLIKKYNLVPELGYIAKGINF